MLLTSILLAESATKLKACPVHHLSAVHAMYGEQDRIQTNEEHADGQDFVRAKVKQLTWLYEKYAAAGSSWNYIAVDGMYVWMYIYVGTSAVSTLFF
jgi:hypothetical protein